MIHILAPTTGADPLELLEKAGGFYECPRDNDGKCLGPLVGYAGRDAEGRQKVGHVYANFAAIETQARALDYIAGELFRVISHIKPGTVFCGMPEGGKSLAFALAVRALGLYVYPEKKITALAKDNSREISELVFKRHSIRAGQQVVIVEDVCNNFSTTAESIEMIKALGAEVLGIACFLNRSLVVGEVFEPESCEGTYPVWALVRKPFGQFNQDDPEVQDEIARGNIVWKPKDNWEKLTS